MLTVVKYVTTGTSDWKKLDCFIEQMPPETYMTRIDWYNNVRFSNVTLLGTFSRRYYIQWERVCIYMYFSQHTEWFSI